MSNKLIIHTPRDDYELLDFGKGRKLERFGSYLVERPAPQATGDRELDNWQPDWVFGSFAAVSRWQAQKKDLPDKWIITLDGQKHHIRLGDKGDVGVQPEQLACREWVRERLRGCYHLEEVNVLNLFGGYGGVSSAALSAGASVTHLDPLDITLNLARENLGEEDIEYIHEDPHAYVDQAVRERLKFDMVILRPSLRQRGPHKRSWDIKCDLGPLMQKLPRVVNSVCRGIWLAPQVEDWSVESLAQFMKEVMPGRSIEQMQIFLATADGRTLPMGVATCAFDDEDEMTLDGERPSLSAEKMEARLDVYLDAILSSRRTAAGPARELAECTREQQEFVLHWVEAIARTNAEMGYQFAMYVPEALKAMNQEEVQEWVLKAMDAFDTAGLHAGIAILKDVGSYVEAQRARQTGVYLDDVAHILEIFLQGLNGRSLKVEPSDFAYTNTDTLYLPEQLNVFENRERNFQLYKVMAAHHWAQSWFGTWYPDLEKELSEFENRDHALELFYALETIRLDGCLQRALPGLYRVLQELCDEKGQEPVPSGFEQAARTLLQPRASVRDTLEWVKKLFGATLPARRCYQGVLQPASVARAKALRMEKDRDALQRMLVRLQEDLKEKRQEQGQEAAMQSAPEMELEAKMDEETGDLLIELTLDGKPVPPPDEVKGVASSIYQDLGEIPPEYLLAAGPGAYHRDENSEDDKSRDVWKGTYHEEGAFLYNEWDFKRQSYRKNWCVMREIDVRPQSASFIQQTLAKHTGLVHEIRRTFEILRGEDKLLKKQPFGEDVDIDALVEAFGDVSSGLEMTDRLFTKKHKVERNIAVMFMVDMSGSTKGWINDAERESLVLLCEALEILGDRYAIYGFSGMTRKRCELYKVKSFDEAYDEDVKSRISGISPQDYTRMGVTIRHLTKLLSEVEARTKLLITLSDGKPDDFDGYRGEYGIEDTRQALIEAKRIGIHPFCITIDTEAHDYLPHMYGAVNYTVIDEVRKLPLRVSDIYRKLTT